MDILERMKAGELIQDTTLSIVIRSGAWIGAGAIILPSITVGEHSIVGARAVVIKDVPDNVIVAGNPAQVMRKIK